MEDRKDTKIITIPIYKSFGLSQHCYKLSIVGCCFIISDEQYKMAMITLITSISMTLIVAAISVDAVRM